MNYWSAITIKSRCSRRPRSIIFCPPICSLDNFDDDFPEVGDFTRYALTPGKSWKDRDGRISSYWIDKFRAFSDQQMTVVYRFLELAEQNPVYANQAASIKTG